MSVDRQPGPLAPDYSDIVEVLKIGQMRANRALDAGYRLLAIGAESDWKKPPGNDKKLPAGYVGKWTVFVVGRPKGVERIDLFDERG